MSETNWESLMRYGIIAWYDFSADSTVLCIGEQDFADFLCERGKKAVSVTVDVSQREDYLAAHEGEYDYIISVGLIEKTDCRIKALQGWKRMLKHGGKLLLGTENRLALRWFCGDKDPFTNRQFDGIENYRAYQNRELKDKGGRCFARNELKDMLMEAGFDRQKYYSVLPGLDWAQLIYAEDYLPEEDMAMRYFPLYYDPDSVFLNEEQLYDGLIKNGLFHQMANAYFIECSSGGIFCNIRHATLSMDRGVEQAFTTIIRADDTVEKKPLFIQGRDKLNRLNSNTRDLQSHGVNMVEGRLTDGAYIMPRIDAPLGNRYMQALLEEDKELFVQKMDRLRDIILMSSEHVGVDKEKGIILKRGYMDLVSLNCFHRDDDFVFFDQEFYQEDYPANAIIYRTVAIIYENNKVRNEILPVSFFWKRYGMEETLGLWQRMSAEFTDTLRHQRELRTFNQEHLRNYHVVVRNRNRMNTDISEVYYDLLRETCFDHLEGKKVYLFGSGKYADKFLAFYQEDYEICGILDNNSDKWGTLMEGIPIESPDRLKERKPEEYKVIVCIRNFRAVLDQLQQMGVTNIGIYDINYVYPCRQRRLLHKDIQAQGTAPKYHIGYVAGVFDLFHIGHLNMFRRAKEMCEYLIVGVVSDEQVRRNKHKEPFVPFEERIEMVRSCRYVDEANKIPIDYAGTVEAFQAYHFDAQFSGSDYVNDPWWLQQKEYLESQGAQLVFFPYTESTSSTMLQSAIRMAVAENKTNQ